MILPDVALHFQQSGFSALTYDPRSVGSSDGEPRNNIDPVKQTEDYSDAISFLADQPNVNTNQIILWGFSFSATISLSAASLDKRARAVIAICPQVNFECADSKLPNVLAKAIQDRMSQVRGNPPFYLPMLTETGENPAGFGIGFELDNYDLILRAKNTAPTFENRTTIQSYYNLVMWQPFPLWRLLSPTPVLFVVPELDKLSPAQAQIQQYNQLSTPKKLHLELGKGHMDVLSGDGFPSLMEIQIRFIRNVLGGSVGI